MTTFSDAVDAINEPFGFEEFLPAPVASRTKIAIEERKEEPVFSLKDLSGELKHLSTLAIEHHRLVSRGTICMEVMNGIRGNLPMVLSGVVSMRDFTRSPSSHNYGTVKQALESQYVVALQSLSVEEPIADWETLKDAIKGRFYLRSESILDAGDRLSFLIRGTRTGYSEQPAMVYLVETEDGTVTVDIKRSTLREIADTYGKPLVVDTEDYRSAFEDLIHACKHLYELLEEPTLGGFMVATLKGAGIIQATLDDLTIDGIMRLNEMVPAENAKSDDDIHRHVISLITASVEDLYKRAVLDYASVGSGVERLTGGAVTEGEERYTSLIDLSNRYAKANLRSAEVNTLLHQMQGIEKVFFILKDIVQSVELLLK